MKAISLVKKQVKKGVYAAIAKVEDQHAFEFKLEGEWCRFIHKHDGGATATGVSEELLPELETLCRESARFEERTQSLKLRPLDVKRFLYLYFQNKAGINKALRRVSVSVRLADFP